MSDTPEAEVLVESGCLLGEGPLWIPETGTLYWTDVVAQELWSWSEKDGVSMVPTITPVGGLARAFGEWLVVSTLRGFGYLDPETGAIAAIGDPKVSPRKALMNDCKCDRMGRLVSGSRHLSEQDPEGRAFVLDKGIARQIEGEFTVWNGPAFSPAGDRIYFADSPTRRIFTAAYDQEAGELGKYEVFAETSGDEGYPDGMTVDADGRLWSARWNGWSVACYNSDGTVSHTVDIDAPQVASITFGGADMKTAFVTTAKRGLSGDKFEAAPLSGHVFTFESDVPGLEEPVYKE
ncbi:MAG: SMP-30/gluconolactonase/LRE family protein [Methyloligellaceae bacterium]